MTTYGFESKDDPEIGKEYYALFTSNSGVHRIEKGRLEKITKHEGGKWYRLQGKYKPPMRGLFIMTVAFISESEEDIRQYAFINLLAEIDNINERYAPIFGDSKVSMSGG